MSRRRWRQRVNRSAQHRAAGIVSQKYIIGEKVLYQQVDSEGVILDLVSERYLGLNEVGARIWQLIRDGHEFDKIQDGDAGSPGPLLVRSLASCKTPAGTRHRRA